MEWDESDDIENDRVNRHARTTEKSESERDPSNIEGLYGVDQAIIQDYLKYRRAQKRNVVGESGTEEESKSVTPGKAQKFELRGPDSV